MKRPANLQLIADDYGLGELHNQAICELLSISSIDGSSVMVELCSKTAAQQLLAAKSQDQKIGLHFNLTYPTSSFPHPASRNSLMLSLPIGIRRTKVKLRLQQQWQLFIELFGCAPDYIDGHEHVHQFIGVQALIADFAKSKSVSVRATALLKPVKGLKNRVIDLLGRTFKRKAYSMGVNTNDWFLGVLPLNRPLEAENELRVQLAHAYQFAKDNPSQTLTMMVHPGSAEDSSQVEGHAAEMRSIEYRVLKVLTSGSE